MHKVLWVHVQCAYEVLSAKNVQRKRTKHLNSTEKMQETEKVDVTLVTQTGNSFLAILVFKPVNRALKTLQQYTFGRKVAVVHGVSTCAFVQI